MKPEKVVSGGQTGADLANAIKYPSPGMDGNLDTTDKL